MRLKVDKYIKCCLKCIAFIPNSGKPEGLLHNVLKGDKPFIMLHVDHLAPASRSHSLKKSRYIFLVIDAFSKYVKLYATKSTNASEAIKCLKSYFEHYSRPLRIISDRGSCFTSRIQRIYERTEHITHKSRYRLVSSKWPG